MKKIISILAIIAATVGFVSCDSDDDNDSGYAEQNMELRATSLGYSDVETYKASVAKQCLANNHENCDIFNDGTHRACAYLEHSGTKHDGSHHNGTKHGSHNENGHSHHSHNDSHH